MQKTGYMGSVVKRILKAITIVAILLVGFSYITSGQTLLLTNKKGNVKKKFHVWDEIYIKMEPHQFIKIPLSQVDSIIRYDNIGSRKEKTTHVERNKLPSPLLLTTFNAKIMTIGDRYIEVLPITYDSLAVDDIRQWTSTNFDIQYKSDANYKKIDIDNIRMIYDGPGWRNGFYTLTAVTGITFMILAPALSIRKDLSFDYEKLSAMGGTGLSVWLISKYVRKGLRKRANYYTTNPEDAVKISRHYKVVNLITIDKGRSNGDDDSE